MRDLDRRRLRPHVSIASTAVLAATAALGLAPTASAEVASPVVSRPEAPTTVHSLLDDVAGSARPQVEPGIVAVRTTRAPDTWTAVRSPATAAGLRTASARAGVIEATLVYRRSAAVVRRPNDPVFRTGRQGWLDAVRLRGAWSAPGRVRVVRVAVIDTGVDLINRELRTRFARDRRGRVIGRDFVGGRTPQDRNGHGTEVAGIIAAATNNRIGIAGGAPNALILPVRVLDANGNGNDLTVAHGIRWAVDRGATVLNLSLGGTGYGKVLASAVAYAVRKGRIVVAAAGNDPYVRLNGELVYPAALPGVIAVGATDNGGHLASFSSTGPYIDVVAPGVNIRSVRLGGGTSIDSGTSFAAPIVAAAVAVARGHGRTVGFIRSGLCRSSHDIGSPGRDTMTGCGLLDASALTRGLAVAPLPSVSDRRDNQPADATVLTTAVADRLGEAGDVDWFRIDQPGAGGRTRYSVSVRPTGVLSSATLESQLGVLLVDAKGAALASSIPRYPESTVSAAVISENGPVYARVFNAQSSGNASYSITGGAAASTSSVTATLAALPVLAVDPKPNSVGTPRAGPITVTLFGPRVVSVSLVRLDGPLDVPVPSTSHPVGDVITVQPTSVLPARSAIAVRVSYIDAGDRYVYNAGAFRTAA